MWSRWRQRLQGRIVELHVVDNQYVHKGDLLMVIDPTNYALAVVRLRRRYSRRWASVKNVGAQMPVQEAQISATRAQLDAAQAALVFANQQSSRYQKLATDGAASIQDAQQFISQMHQQEAQKQSAQGSLSVALRQIESLKAQRLVAEASLAQSEAQLHQAQVNLERTRILSPVDGYVTNLQAQLGNFANAGASAISIVDGHSFWVDGYFEETKLAPLHVGDPAQIKLMGYREIVRGQWTVSPAPLAFRTPSPTMRVSPPSILSSPGYASHNASPSASILMMCPRVSFLRPA